MRRIYRNERARRDAGDSGRLSAEERLFLELMMARERAAGNEDMKPWLDSQAEEKPKKKAKKKPKTTKES